MDRISKFAAPMIFVAVAWALSGCGNSDGTKTAENANKTEENSPATQGEDLSTPEKTLAAAKAAAENHNYTKLCQYFTPTARQDLAAGMVMLGGFMQASAENPIKQPEGQEDSAKAEEDKKRAEAVKKLFEEYELTKEKRPEININLNDSHEQQKKQLRKLAEPIEDHCRFFADFVGVMREHGTKADAVMIEGDAKLENLKIEGDQATAQFVQTREGSEKRSPIAFQKIESQWLISEIPNLLN